MKTNYKIQGKKNRESGQRFELKVRKDFESKGWIVDRWSNNVMFPIRLSTYTGKKLDIDKFPAMRFSAGKLIPAKSRFNLRTTGFPDFICFRKYVTSLHTEIGKGTQIGYSNLFEVIGVECKSNGYLTKEEKEKCKWLLENNVFSKILIAKKGKKRGEIEYTEFK